MPDESELTKMAVRYDRLQQELQRLDQHLSSVEQAAAGLRRAAATLAGLQGQQGEQEVLVPVGAGVYLHGRVDPNAPVLRPVGADYATESSAEDALEHLHARLKDAEASMQQLSQEARKVAGTLQELGQQLESMDSSDSPSSP